VSEVGRPLALSSWSPGVSRRATVSEDE
jgi:hypothetical protein